MRLDSAIRVYVDPGAQTVRVAADFRFDQSRRGCFHLQYDDGRMAWVKHPEGDFVAPISLEDFTRWMRHGGLREVSPVLGIGDNDADTSEEVTR